MHERLCTTLILTTALLLTPAWREGPRAAETIRVGGTGGAMRTMEVLGEAFRKERPDVSVAIVSGLGSRGAKKALAAGALDLGVAAEPVHPADQSQGLVGGELGRTPFVLAVGNQTAVSRLSTAELVDIFAGKRTTWPDGSRLRLVLRPRGDSDIAVLQGMSPQMRQAVDDMLERPGMKVAATDGEAADAIEATPGALGMSTLALLLSEKRALRPLALDGVSPTPRAIADGSYRYYKSFTLVTRGLPTGTLQQFLEFVGSARGQDVLLRLGYWVPANGRR
jgi:phosphate transport system substrate-binding protein